MKRLFISIVLLFAFASCSDQSTRSYYEEIKAQISIYDEQNEQVLKGIPMPPAVQKLSATRGGVVDGPAFARTLIEEYSATTSFTNISLFYSEQLPRTGWQKASATEHSLLFTLNTSCIQILDLTPNGDKVLLSTNIPVESRYIMAIWHDFFSQSFSMPTPDGINLCAEMFADACLPCPPK